jgi:hypothetical protein
MAGISNPHAVLALLITAQFALPLIDATSRPAAASDETALARCSSIYNASACRCALDAVTSVGGEWSTPLQPTQVASTPTAATLAAVMPATGGTRPRFSERDVVHILQACMAPGHEAPAD